MAELAKADFAVSRELMARDDAVQFFRDMGEEYKAEIYRIDSGRGGSVALSPGRFHRSVSWSTRAEHRQTEGVQAHENRRGLLAR